MKKLLLICLLLFIASPAIGQTKLYDSVFINAKDPVAYDEFIKEHYAKIHKERVKRGYLLQWDVWKVVDTPQEDFTHMVTYIYDIEKYPNQGTKAYEMVGMSQHQWLTIQEKVNSIRDRIGQAKWSDLGNGMVRKKGMDYLPNIMVLNMIHAKEGSWGTYEKEELKRTAKIPANSARVGWSFHRRIGEYGDDILFTHLTIDWFDSYKSYLQNWYFEAQDRQENDFDWNELRQLKKMVVLEKFISSTD
ncbi:MAG TPA: hypothetical protein DIT52_00470 [Flavobacteriaceae bacterium]|nr:hypothetical protein [Flavobacteriaceae bacterium]|tara:strand:- start:8966 stop:9706 length:741 start_codon:yes stop_codon:yes gene_type:complete